MPWFFFSGQWLVDSFPGTDVDGWSWCYPYISLYVHLVVGMESDCGHRSLTQGTLGKPVLCRMVDVSTIRHNTHMLAHGGTQVKEIEKASLV